MSQQLRLLIADDHTALRLGLVTIAESVPHIRVIGEAVDGVDAVARYQELKPDVMILDLRMPKLDGIEVVERVLSFDPQARILVMTMYDHEEDIFRSVRAGARGYILKSAPREEILKAIEAVARGERYMPQYVALKLAAHMATPQLTTREREVLELMQIGITNKEIGTQLHLTEGTIKSHVREIMAKLNAISRTEAVNLAVQRGLLKS
ncbi:MAG: response regulator transcription factor [Pseudomonadota bacterium]|nr:response regulator transcription factor [Pseudomonadota bacterium]